MKSQNLGALAIYRAANPAVKFISVFILYLIVYIAFLLIIKAPVELVSAAVFAATWAGIVSFWTRSGTRTVQARDHAAFRAGLKKAMLERYHLAEESENALYFHPRSAWGLIFDGTAVRVERDQIIIRGPSSWIQLVERKLVKAGLAH